MLRRVCAAAWPPARRLALPSACAATSLRPPPCFAAQRRGFPTDLEKLGPPVPVKVLVIDGYDRDGRDALKKGGMLTAAELFVRMLEFNRPDHTQMQCHVVFPCDDNYEEPDFASYDGICWTGSSLSVKDSSSHPGVERVNKMAKTLRKLEVPQFGSCYGIQLMSMAFDGDVQKSPQGREMGIGRKVHLTEEGRRHPMYEGKPAVFEAIMSHNDEVCNPPKAMNLLATNYHSKWQGASVDYNDTQFWAVQYHPEFSLHDLARLTKVRTNLLIDQGFFKDAVEVERYVKDLDALHDDPTRKDLKWKLGIDGTILDQETRQIEVRNWLSKMVLPRSEDRLESKARPIRTSDRENISKKHRVGVAFDVDGVLVHGGNVVESAKTCLKELEKDKIPFIFMTNGGGYPEHQKAKDLSKKLGIKVSPEQVCLSHTPLQALKTVHEHDKILLVGKHYEKLQQVMEDYGYQNVITTEQWHANDPSCYNDIPVKWSGKENMSPDLIMILNDPLLWGRDLQIVTDAVLKSEKRVEVYNAAADLTYASNYDLPRYGAGSFRVALDALFKASTGRDLEQHLLGKPATRTYRHAEAMLNALSEKRGQRVPDTIFGIGDNLDTDIAGANRAGGRWVSVLTKGGLYTHGPHEARHLFDHVGDACDFIRKFQSDQNEGKTY